MVEKDRTIMYLVRGDTRKSLSFPNRTNPPVNTEKISNVNTIDVQSPPGFYRKGFLHLPAGRQKKLNHSHQ